MQNNVLWILISKEIYYKTESHSELSFVFIFQYALHNSFVVYRNILFRENVCLASPALYKSAPKTLKDHVSTTA